MDYYIILENNYNIFTKTEQSKTTKIKTNQLPLTYEEAKSVIEKNKKCNLKCINISKDIRENGLTIEENQLLEERQRIVYTWRNEFLDNNIKGFNMPIEVECNNDYITKLKEILDKYLIQINKIAFKYEENLLEEIRENCSKVLTALNIYLEGDKEKAKKIISLLIKSYIEDPFWVSDLDKSYAFRGIAPFFNLHSEGYEKQYKTMMEEEIDFYRARPERIKSDRKELLHIPYDLMHLVKEQRFSLDSQPCLYLGTTSYVCWKECREPKLGEFYISSFKPNEEGKKLKIFNLVVSEPLINGIYEKSKYNLVEKNLQQSMLKIFPIVLATSFSIKDNNRKNEKYEYIIPHLVMQSLSELNIDGVAYLSKRVSKWEQYPQGVNLAIPVLDISKTKQYGDVCSKFLMTKPTEFNKVKELDCDSKCYINKVFNDDYYIRNYKEKHKSYFLVDNNLISKEYELYNNIDY